MGPILCSWIDEHAERRPDKVALVNGDRRVTYAELREEQARWAGVLMQRGVLYGDRVAALLNNRVECIALQAACAHLGAVFAPLNTRLAPREVSRLLQDASPRVLFYEHATAKLARMALVNAPVRHGIDLDSFGANLRSASRYPCAARPRDPALLLYTSGSTGQPRGVSLTHENLWWNHRQFLDALPIGPDDVNYCAAPLFHAAGLNTITGPLLFAGGTTVLEARFEPQRARATIVREHATCGFMVPTMWRGLLDAGGGRPIGHFRYGLTGGAPCPPELIRQAADHELSLMQGYGMTESGPMGTLLGAEDALEHAGSVGYVGRYMDMTIVDGHGRPVVAGEAGEVLLRGPNIMLGYWQNPEASAEALQGGWLHTGDIGRLDDAGRLHIVGRTTDMIISGGENVHPAEVERHLSGHPGVVDLAVFGAPDEHWGERVCCAVVVRDGARVDLESLRHRLRGLARYKWPRQLLVVDELPRNPTGKLVRSALCRMVVARS